MKKNRAHSHDLDRKQLAIELGDILWYVAQATKEIGFTLDDIAILNINKLMERYPNGFEAERSKNRGLKNAK